MFINCISPNVLQRDLVLVSLGCSLFNYQTVIMHMRSVATLWARSDFVVIPVEQDQSEPAVNMWSLCAVSVIQPEVTAWSSRGWN